MRFQLFVFLLLEHIANSIKVKLTTGEIEGKDLNSTYSPFGNQSAIVFLGIPFAKPPVGDLRFRKPQPIVPWDGVLETKEYRSACMSDPLRTYRNDVGDILAAVKWVRKEIKSFGGNKDRITLMGHSGGAGLTAVVISFFKMNVWMIYSFQFSNSPLTKGLIHQQVVMSIPLPHLSKQANFKATTVVAQMVGCLEKEIGFESLPKRQIEDTYSCLRATPAQEILDAELFILQNSTYFFGSPPIDGEFVVDYPDRQFSANSIYPINTLIGTTTAELRQTQFIDEIEDPERKDFFVRNVCEHIGYELYKKPEEFANKCYVHYSNGSEVRYLSDDMEFYSQALLLANAHSTEETKVYVYSYAYTGAGSAYKTSQHEPSPHHSEDLIYVLGTARGTFIPKDYVIEKIYSGMIANFVNFGDPSPSKEQPWLQYTPENREHFLIDFNENLAMPGMRDHYYENTLKFWSNAGEKTFREHWAPSLDTFYITNLVIPMKSHVLNKATDFYKSLESSEKMYREREEFLEELKMERIMEKSKGNGRRIMERNGDALVVMDERDLGVEESGGGGISRFSKLVFQCEVSFIINKEISSDILLIIFGITLIGGVFCVTLTHCCLHYRSRQGYQLLK
ncbi:hypothetical protein CAEBREN_31994 [Caenorhabditis brenneri]|uniref:Carboxylic ester hydrolase n=1 Tax=Caenorhabditis brenneri TaxID=135651 RepID=G0NEZ2_CAEBE|nr:hypothetical protein CAEBREN_31994 [Caenorhabditis brenneri]